MANPAFEAAHAPDPDDAGQAPPPPAEPPVAEPQRDDGRPRDESGRFAPKDADKPAGEAAKPAERPLSRTVPYDAFHKERMEAKRLREEAKERDEKFARLQARIDMLQEGWSSPQKPGQAEDLDLGPDPDQDPVGAVKWAREQRAADLRARKEWEAQQANHARSQEAQTQESQKFYTDLGEANREWSEAAGQYPELDHVLEGLRKSFSAELQAGGLYGPQLVQRLNQVEMQHAVYAYRQGIPVVQYMAQLARARGVSLPGQPQQPQPQGQPQAHPPPNGAGQARPDPSAGIKQLAEAQNAAQTLSGSGGSSGAGKMTLEALDRMSDDEFREFIRTKNARDPQGFEKWKRAQMVGA